MSKPLESGARNTRATRARLRVMSTIQQGCGVASVLVLAVICPIAVAAPLCSASAQSGSRLADSAVARQLGDLEAADRAKRSATLGQGSSGFPTANGASQSGARSLDSANAVAVDRIIAAYGVPRISHVGQPAAEFAWRVILASPNPDLQRRVLALSVGLPRADLPVDELAQLTDQILVREGHAQRYGTQFVLIGDRLYTSPIEDLSHLDERRKLAGLSPMLVYVEKLRSTSPVPIVWPPRQESN
jgi:hypothetical protein